MDALTCASLRKNTPASARSERDFEVECVELFAAVASALGVPRSLGQIYGVLYASPEPLTFSAILARLDISKGSVSQGLALLRSWGAVQVTAPVTLGEAEANRTRGTRGSRMAFVPELSLRRLVSGVIRDRIYPLATEGVERLDRLNAIARASDARSRTHHIEQARRLSAWRRQLKTVLPMLMVLLGPKRKDATSN